MASRVLSGSLTPRDLAAWAHTTFGHTTLELAERLAELDDAYDILAYTDMTREDVDAQVRVEARRIADGAQRTFRIGSTARGPSTATTTAPSNSAK